MSNMHLQGIMISLPNPWSHALEKCMDLQINGTHTWGSMGKCHPQMEAIIRFPFSDPPHHRREGERESQNTHDRPNVTCFFYKHGMLTRTQKQKQTLTCCRLGFFFMEMVHCSSCSYIEVLQPFSVHFSREGISIPSSNMVFI